MYDGSYNLRYEIFCEMKNDTKMHRSTNKSLTLLYMKIVYVSSCLTISGTSAIHDDRIDQDPDQDRILGRLIQERKNFRLSRGIEECVDTTVFYATFSIVSARDSVYKFLKIVHGVYKAINLSLCAYSVGYVSIL